MASSSLAASKVAKSLVLLTLVGFVTVTAGVEIVPWKTKLKVPTAHLSIGAVGDVLFEDALQIQAFKRNGSYDSAWQEIVPFLKRPDIMFANHEGTVSNIVSWNVSGKADPQVSKCTLVQRDEDMGPSPMVYGQYSFRGPFYSGGPHLQFNYHPELSKALNRSGIDVMSTANNHCLDRGYLGVNHTLDYLDAAGIQHAGTRRAALPDYEGWYAVVERKGWRTAWIACTDSSNFARNCRAWDRSLVLDCYSKDMVEAVKYLSGRTDIHAVIAVTHWGTFAPKDPKAGAYARSLGYDNGVSRGIVYQREPDCLQRNFSHILAEAGATAVIAMHPHVPQGFEKYVVPQTGRKVLIVQSLGNFVSAGGWSFTLPPPGFLDRGLNSLESLLYRRTSPLLNFNLAFDKKKNWAEVSCLSYLPLFRRLSIQRNTNQSRKNYFMCDAPNVCEIFVEVAEKRFNKDAYDFMTWGFGQLQSFEDGSGTVNGSRWMAPLPPKGKEDQLKCYDWSALPASNVDDSVPKNWVFKNPDGKKYDMPPLQCMKCERTWDGNRTWDEDAAKYADKPGCRWCAFQPLYYCKAADNVKIDLVKKYGEMAWDDCLRRVSKEKGCGRWAYSGGGTAQCTCIKPGYPCKLIKSARAATVYMHFCDEDAGPQSTGGISKELLANAVVK